MKNKIQDVLLNVIYIVGSLMWLGVLTQLQFKAYIDWEVSLANMLLPITIFFYALVIKTNLNKIDEIDEILTSKIQKDDTSEDFNS